MQGWAVKSWYAYMLSALAIVSQEQTHTAVCVCTGVCMYARARACVCVCVCVCEGVLRSDSLSKSTVASQARCVYIHTSKQWLHHLLNSTEWEVAV